VRGHDDHRIAHEPRRDARHERAEGIGELVDGIGVVGPGHGDESREHARAYRIFSSRKAIAWRRIPGIRVEMPSAGRSA
jgi:hypothetical protein